MLVQPYVFVTGVDGQITYHEMTTQLAEPSHDYTFRQAMDGADTNRLCCVVQ